MTLAAGTRLGNYEIVAQIGAGGMGEVYRAKDPRLNRDVAVKVLPKDFLEGKEARERFEREARILASLNHPGIAAIYSFEEIPGSPSSSSASSPVSSRSILVMELVDGESLRDRLRAGAMPPKKAVELATQLAEGLAAAHARGIVHRDVKPENVLLTRDGRVKILDFGLAKQLPKWTTQSGPHTNMPTEAPSAAHTEAGVVMGTVGYMSPEQVRGEPADHRTDVFSFGAVLYEMLGGRKAFGGATGVETMNAILNEEPPSLVVTKGQMPPALERVVLHCLEKSPENRFQSMKDVAFDLNSISTISAVDGGRPAARARGGAARWAAAGGALVLLAGLAAFLGGAVHLGRHEQPVFHQVSFRQGRIAKARFAPNGQDVIYDASWQGEPWKLFATPIVDPKERSLGQSDDVQLLDASPSGELVLRLKPRVSDTWQFEGTLARSALGGDVAPKPILGGVLQAAWAPKSEFAVVRAAGGRSLLDYPAGKTRVESAGWIGDLRFSPDGSMLAYVDHPAAGDDAGRIAVLDVAGGKTRVLSKEWGTLRGLAWKGKEIWFTAGTHILNRALHAVDLSGRERTVFTQAGGLYLHDVGANGRVLLSREEMRGGLLSQAETQPPLDLSWRTWSYLLDTSRDGKTLLFEEEEGDPGGYDLFLRPAAGGHATPLGKSAGYGALSPDGSLAVAWLDKPAPRWAIYPTGTGAPREIPAHGIRGIKSVEFSHDNKSLVFIGQEGEKEDRVWTLALDGKEPKPLTLEGVTGLETWPLLSPDGRSFLAREKGGWAIFDFAKPDAPPRRVAGLEDGEVLTQWRPDGKFLVTRPGAFPVAVSVLDPATGKRQPWKSASPAGYLGVDCSTIRFSDDGRQMAARYILQRSTLYVVDGLR